MKLTPKQAQEAGERALAYEANMAVEGMRIDPRDRAVIDRIDADGVSYDEAFAMLDAHFGDPRSAIAAE